MPVWLRTGRTGWLGLGRRRGSTFFVCFNTLIQASGLTPREISSRLRGTRHAVGRTTIYEWINGQHLPENADQFLAVMHACMGAAGERQADLGGLPRDDEAWRRVLAAAGGKTTRGKVISDWDPIRLGVYRVIGGGKLPAYVTRDHDDLLHAALDPGSAANRLIVLRGGSSTGKSRTAFEAIRARLPTWLVDYPPSEVATLARLSAGLRPQTVLWLDELRDYAETRAGRNALARLADLLGGEDKVIVLATLGPSSGGFTSRDRRGSRGRPIPTL